MNTDDDLTHLFHTATTDPHRDFAVADVIARGTERGRRLRRRRTLTLTAAGIATAAVITPLAWVGSTALTTEPDGGDLVVATTPGTPDEITAPSRIPAFDDAGTADELREILTEIAADHEIVSVNDPGTMNRSGSRAVATLRDASGESQVSVEIWPANPATTLEEELATWCGPEADDPAECSSVDGGTLAIQESSWDNHSGETYLANIADYITDDGLRVRADASNNTGVALMSLSPERPEAPLTLDEVVEIATDPRWIVEGSLPRPPAQVPLKEIATASTTEAQSVLTDLVADLFPDATITPAESLPTGRQMTASVVVDDGNGPSFVQVFLDEDSTFNYHSWLSDELPCMDNCREDEHGKLDLLRLEREKPDSAGVTNAATYQRADGVVVTVSSSNTEVSDIEATTTTRNAPLLSAEQAAKVARSDAWVR